MGDEELGLGLVETPSMIVDIIGIEVPETSLEEDSLILELSGGLADEIDAADNDDSLLVGDRVEFEDRVVVIGLSCVGTGELNDSVILLISAAGSGRELTPRDCIVL